MKFGGATVCDARAILNAVEIVQSYLSRGDQVVVVVSALPGITDTLLNISAIASKGDVDSMNRLIEQITKLHEEVIRGCVRNPDLEADALQTIRQTISELGAVLTGVALLKEITPRSRDFVLSFGEQLSAPIVCMAAKDSGLVAEWFTGGAAGITTDESFGEASPLMEITAHRTRERLLPMLAAGKVPIVAGFGAQSPERATTTLGRGGSDYTATLLGAALNADATIIWKEVDGLMTADPKIVPEAQVLSSISYAEAGEMAYFGAKAIHPKALEPAVERQMPVFLRNAFNLSNEGTRINSGSSAISAGVVKAVTLIGMVGMVTVTGANMVGLAGAAARVFKVLGDADTNILMISQSSSEKDISLVIQRDRLHETVTALERSMLGGVVKNVKAESDVCVIAAVGARMKGTPGVAARLLKAVADEGVNVRMIAQGSSELNISFVVSESDGPKTIKAIHKEFNLNKT